MSDSLSMAVMGVLRSCCRAFPGPARPV